MKYIVQIDDNTTIGKYLVGLLKSLLKKEEGIEILSEIEIEKREDKLLAKMMQESLQSGLANKQSVLAKLNIK